MNRNIVAAVALAAAVAACTWPGVVLSQQPAAKARQADTNSPGKSSPGRAAAKAPQDKPVYDVYEPSQRLRTRRQECMRDEEPLGAYCVKKCQSGYQSETSGRSARCRSIEPLPPGSVPTPVRKEIGTQPSLPEPAKPRPRQPGA